MATVKKSSNENIKGPASDDLMEKLKQFIRARGAEYLQDKNISSIGIGYKNVNGKPTNEIAIQFTVDVKAAPESLKSLKTTEIPKTINVDGIEVPTDVVERSFVPSFKLVKETEVELRKSRMDPVQPGLSIAITTETAGTIGTIVFDKKDGTPYMLSNWHVLHGNRGHIGDDIVQPGPFDDNRIHLNRVGKLVRSHLGAAGDCAIANIEDRKFDNIIFELGVKVDLLGEPELGDKVIKSGRTTGVTHGIVTRVNTMVKIDYEGSTGEQSIGGFEIGVDEDNMPGNGEISMGGDSGSIWLLKGPDGKPMNVMVGLHFAGEGSSDPTEHAIACYAKSVFDKLEIAPVPPAQPVADAQNAGYAIDFLSQPVKMPLLSLANEENAFKLNGSPVINYTHFSLAVNQERRLAFWVAWNIDGGKLRKISRNGLRFVFDPRIPVHLQAGDELYAGNRLDRGHIARRADLLWGTMQEAKKANKDSFFFTNIAPQMDNFNQSTAGGIWGKLEDALFEEVDVEDLRVSIFGGPVFRTDDREYRGLLIPREFFKVLVFVDNGRLKTKAFLLTQNLDVLEVLDLNEFKVFEVTLAELEERCGIIFPANLKNVDELAESLLREPQSIHERKPLTRIADIDWK
jgi:endonuclease G